jgi:hypothetical protein
MHLYADSKLKLDKMDAYVETHANSKNNGTNIIKTLISKSINNY